MTQPKKRTAATRLLCSPDTLSAYEQEMVRQISVLKRLIGKGEMTDAIVAVALRHSKELTKELNKGRTPDNDD